jgi:hypothetical protein
MAKVLPLDPNLGKPKKLLDHVRDVMRLKPPSPTHRNPHPRTLAPRRFPFFAAYSRLRHPCACLRLAIFKRSIGNLYRAATQAAK